jgi:hypothetical protein
MKNDKAKAVLIGIATVLIAGFMFGNNTPQPVPAVAPVAAPAAPAECGAPSKHSAETRRLSETLNRINPYRAKEITSAEVADFIQQSMCSGTSYETAVSNLIGMTTAQARLLSGR